MMECTFCGADVEAHDPVVVYEDMDQTDDPAGRFCNYACLEQHIAQANLTAGAACNWTPDADCC
jgi:hypothetical protein